jgi:hypothetical protein
VIHHPVDKNLASEIPFVVGLVQLEEGPRISGRIVGCRPADIKAGTPVTACYDDVDNELTLLNFKTKL